MTAFSFLALRCGAGAALGIPTLTLSQQGPILRDQASKHPITGRSLIILGAIIQIEPLLVPSQIPPLFPLRYRSSPRLAFDPNNTSLPSIFCITPENHQPSCRRVHRIETSDCGLSIPSSSSPLHAPARTFERAAVPRTPHEPNHDTLL